MTVVLTVLKIIGIILLVILALLLLVVLLVLFSPIRYGADGAYKEKDYHVQAKAWWFLHTVHITFRMAKESTEGLTVRLFGIPIIRTGRPKKQKAGKESLESMPPDMQDVHEEEEALPDMQAELPEPEPPVLLVEAPEPLVTGKKEERKEGPFRKKAAKTKKEKRVKKERQVRPLLDRLFQAEETIEQKIERLQDAVEHRIDQLEAADWLLHSTLFDEALAEGRSQTGRIIRQVMPRKAYGEIHIGFGDPGTTGEVYGACVTALGFIPRTDLRRLCVEPHFHEKRMDAALGVKGAFRTASLIPPAWKLYKSKKIHAVIRRFRRIIHG